ncbi:MAG: molybdenum cofactor biosynthesis protein MoeB [Bacteroidetes bacterium]|nr:MAG: molybdenum cofactor biosynthesis protein MoeB [Bacteroidota bacterium]PTM13760.1 MAG: molybdenum cofactor biosynthesis protein MoeB [Bacteroidota bacterium]
MGNPQLSDAETLRYARHVILPQFGEAGQLKLKAASVLVIGAGGLGSPLLLYLAAAGVGTIGIVDPDRVTISNLQRQVLYGEKDLGKLKVEAAKARLNDLNPHVQIHTYPTYFTTSNALELIASYDAIADGTDNFPTRYLVNDACVLGGKPYVYGSIFRFEGQVSVFNALGTDGQRGPNYRDLYPIPPLPDQVPNCATGGVLGVLPGIIGALQANEVLKILTGVGELLAGRLLLFDAAYLSQRTIQFPAQAATSITELIDYEAFCGMPVQEELPTMDLATFRALQQQQIAYTLLDVREPQEYAINNWGGILIPLGQLAERWRELPAHQPIIVHCQSGIRSAQAVSLLLKQGLSEVYNLAGGIADFPQAD